MSERKIQLALVDMIRSAIVCACPNYTPAKWWECDLWAVKKSGRWTEYEIKQSVEDFKADAKKAQAKWDASFMDRTVESKHVLLAGGSDRGPSQFYYVVTEKVKDKIELTNLLPDWAGLVVARPHHGLHGQDPTTYYARVVKVAPTLNKCKTSTREIRLAQNRMWYRYWESIRNLERVVDDRKLMIERVHQKVVELPIAGGEA